jgi:hypothetical protein
MGRALIVVVVLAYIAWKVYDEWNKAAIAAEDWLIP